jgi:hypothetical protein
VVLFATTDLPTSINSLEKLHVWSSVVLQHLHPSTTIIESTGNAQLVMSSAPFFISSVDPPVWRVISRSSIQLNANWQRGTSKIWTHAIDISSASIPTEFKS